MKITIYSKLDCAHCVRAKNFLDGKNIPYLEMKLGQHFDREELFRQVPTARTYPVVVIDGKHIGGADQLIKLLG